MVGILRLQNTNANRELSSDVKENSVEFFIFNASTCDYFWNFHVIFIIVPRALLEYYLQYIKFTEWINLISYLKDEGLIVSST